MFWLGCDDFVLKWFWVRCAGRIPLISFIMENLQFDLLFAVFPCASLPPHYLQRPLDVVKATAQAVLERDLTVLPAGVDLYVCACLFCTCIVSALLLRVCGANGSLGDVDDCADACLAVTAGLRRV